MIANVLPDFLQFTVYI